jgi:hypothetical protein
MKEGRKSRLERWLAQWKIYRFPVGKQLLSCRVLKGERSGKSQLSVGKLLAGRSAGVGSA